MSVERRIAIAARLDDERRMLTQDIASAAARARKAEPGDRLDIVRYEALSSQLESWVYDRVARGEAACVSLPSDTPVIDEPLLGVEEVPVWVPQSARPEFASALQSGGVLLTLRLPLETGVTDGPAVIKKPPPVAEEFDANGLRGREAVVARFEDQLQKAVTARAQPKPICPTGIQNVVLTDSLREFVGQEGKRVDVPVEYKDGSRASHPFPLRALKLYPNAVAGADLSLKFSLLSIRHTELDSIVDGAWLRNVQISQPRPAAQTDDLVYDISRKQLAALTKNGRRIEIEMYQTGLEMAVVGFYRALVDHLIAEPASVAVRPMYHQEPRKGARRPERSGGEITDALYRAGTWWAMKPKGR